jgi:hypothetical protein
MSYSMNASQRREMIAVNRTIIFYMTVDGKCLVQDFLDALPGKASQRVAWVFHRNLSA